MMDAANQMQRARQHLRDGESLAADLREFIIEERIAGRSTREADRVLQRMQTTLEHLRDICK